MSSKKSIYMSEVSHEWLGQGDSSKDPETQWINWINALALKNCLANRSQYAKTILEPQTAAVPKSRHNCPNVTHQVIFWQDVCLRQPQLLCFNYVDNWPCSPHFPMQTPSSLSLYSHWNFSPASSPLARPSCSQLLNCFLVGFHLPWWLRYLICALSKTGFSNCVTCRIFLAGPKWVSHETQAVLKSYF